MPNSDSNQTQSHERRRMKILTRGVFTIDKDGKILVSGYTFEGNDDNKSGAITAMEDAIQNINAAIEVETKGEG